MTPPIATPTPNAYRESAVLSAPPEVLVVMLYDGARRFLFQAAIAMRDRQIELSHRKLRRAEDIIRHLLDTLDMDQGEISQRLEAIYLFCLRHLQQARFDRDANKLDQVSNLLGELREAWATIAGR
ncbi:MAG TPA: flagellar export chaperone FliS [Solirubrobacteraceae bacterium]|nr:flagellar export chaperone FliS [Solirubrobacteraceae bacterium]